MSVLPVRYRRIPDHPHEEDAPWVVFSDEEQEGTVEDEVYRSAGPRIPGECCGRACSRLI